MRCAVSMDRLYTKSSTGMVPTRTPRMAPVPYVTIGRLVRKWLNTTNKPNVTSV